MIKGWQLLTLLMVLAVGLPGASQEIRRIEVGVQYSAIGIPSVRVGCVGCMAVNHGLGTRFVVNFSRALSVDSEVDFFPAAGAGASNVEGGRVITGFYGLKAGHRGKRFGIFGKFRLGLQSYGRVITSVTSDNPVEFSYGRRLNLAYDFGAVVEYYARKRMALRFDYGDSRIRFGTGVGHYWGNNLQAGMGVVFRF